MLFDSCKKWYLTVAKCCLNVQIMCLAGIKGCLTVAKDCLNVQINVFDCANSVFEGAN